MLSFRPRLFALILLAAQSTSAFALDPKVKELVFNETRSNAVAARSDQMKQIENFEVPLRILEPNLSDRLTPDVRDALIFEKRGEKFVRWIINPEDTKWRLRMEKFLRDKGVWPVRHKYFTGYQTASRSYIVEDPKSHAQFSLKVSTNKTGGNWTDKKQTAEDAGDVRRATDYVFDQSKKEPFKNFVVMDEPAAFRANEIDQGMLVRTLADLPKGDHYYLPGFSAVHEDMGRTIAELNGATNVAEFWNHNYNRPLGRTLAELASRTGVSFDSPHSQNFLVELDNNYKPTGRIVLRDLGDIYLNTEIVTANGAEALLKSWPAENVVKGTISDSVGILHGNKFPKWMTDAEYDQWGEDFYKEYDKEVSRVTGIPESELKGKHYRNGNYMMRGTPVKGENWKAYLSSLRKARYPDTAPAHPWKISQSCDRAYAAIR
ncbi:MAG: hypothetical protein EOP11_11455 [Proteobacteria bacterium]|nr:MAG: hypothetical protein EOP11_11455 [Pseudomonadota bacterium]